MLAATASVALGGQRAYSSSTPCPGSWRRTRRESSISASRSLQSPALALESSRTSSGFCATCLSSRRSFGRSLGEGFARFLFLVKEGQQADTDANQSCEHANYLRNDSNPIPDLFATTFTDNFARFLLPHPVQNRMSFAESRVVIAVKIRIDNNSPPFSQFLKMSSF